MALGLGVEMVNFAEGANVGTIVVSLKLTIVRFMMASRGCQEGFKRASRLEVGWREVAIPKLLSCITCLA